MQLAPEVRTLWGEPIKRAYPEMQNGYKTGRMVVVFYGGRRIIVTEATYSASAMNPLIAGYKLLHPPGGC